MRCCSRTIALFIGGCWLALPAAQRHLKYEDPGGMETYGLTFDDRKISADTIERIVWLAPDLIFDLKNAPFQMSSSRWGKDVIDKSVSIPWLEVCNPGYNACDHPVLDAAFLKNAHFNLQRGRQQIEQLKRMVIPRELWPVRDHFLEGMEFSSKQHEIRYQYLKSDEVEPLRKLLCEQCPCGEAEAGLIRKLKNTKGTARLELSNRTWFNKIIDCRNSKQKYPVDAWKRFLQTYGIEEKYSFPHAE